jgi:hypothetical protein
LGRFAISGSSVYDCWCILQGVLHVSMHMEVQNRCDAILRAFLIVGVGFLWYCWNSFSFIIVDLFGRVICSSVVMLNRSNWCRYLRFRLAVMLE